MVLNFREGLHNQRFLLHQVTPESMGYLQLWGLYLSHNIDGKAYVLPLLPH